MSDATSDIDDVGRRVKSLSGPQAQALNTYTTQSLAFAALKSLALAVEYDLRAAGIAPTSVGECFQQFEQIHEDIQKAMRDL